MAYPYTRQLQYPVKKYRVQGLRFGAHGIYGGINWGEHLGEDVVCPKGTPVLSIGRGRVVYAALHPGNGTKSNWGNIMIVVHKHPVTRMLFYAVYGHLGVLLKNDGACVDMGEIIGTVGASNTVENGWWSEEHVHVGIYTGIWDGKVFPGYYRAEQKRTERDKWVCPQDFIEKYGTYKLKKTKK